MFAKKKAAVAPPKPSIAWLPWVRLLTGIMLGIVVYTALPHHHGAVIRAVIGWDAGVFVLSAWIMAMMALSTNDHMRRRAARQDLGRWVILFVIIAVTSFLKSLFSIILSKISSLSFILSISV